MKTNLKYYLYFIIILSLCLLILHTFNLWQTNVDNISICLLGCLGLLPFLSAIKKIKWNDIEAEIGDKEINKLKEELKFTSTTPQSTKRSSATSIKEYNAIELIELHKYVYSILENDNVLALAKIRIELETLLRKVYVKVTGLEDKYYPINFMIDELIKSNVFLKDSNYLVPIREIMNICNRALHGEEISDKNSIAIVEMGLRSISYLSGFMKAQNEDESNTQDSYNMS